MPGVRRGDIYGPPAGPSGIVSMGPVDVYFDNVLREGQPPAPVTEKAEPGGRTLGQFTLAQATVGLIVLILFLAWSDGVVGR